MNLKTITLVTILFSGALLQSQSLTPTELETAKLGKLKSDLAALSAQLQNNESQKQALEYQKQLLQQQGQQKYSEFLGLAESVKQAHALKDKCIKDCVYWDSADKVTFNPQSGEAGQFTHNPEPPKTQENKEDKKDVKQEDSKEKDEKGQKIKTGKDKSKDKNKDNK